MKLPSIDRPHLPTRVAQMITQQIEAGRMKAGDQLPTEQELSNTLGVSRNVVREAIARLRSDGIVQARQGTGTFLSRAPSSTLRIDAESLKDGREFKGVFELRAILEIRAAGLAAERQQADGLKDLKTALALMRGGEKWEDTGVDADLDFHRAVARTTGNPYLEKVVAFVSEQVRETITATRRRLRPIEAIVEVTIEEHVAIYESIRRGAPLAARKAMSRHIRNAADRLGVDLTIDHRS